MFCLFQFLVTAGISWFVATSFSFCLWGHVCFLLLCVSSLFVCLSVCVSLSIYILYGCMQGIGLCDYGGSAPQSVVCELETQKSSVWCQCKSKGLRSRGADGVSPGPSPGAGEDHCPHSISQAKRVNSPFLNVFSYSGPQWCFKLGCSCFTILCQFLVHNGRNQQCGYMYPLPLEPSSHLPLPSHLSRWSQRTELSSLGYTVASY